MLRELLLAPDGDLHRKPQPNQNFSYSLKNKELTHTERLSDLVVFSMHPTKKYTFSFQIQLLLEGSYLPSSPSNCNIFFYQNIFYLHFLRILADILFHKNMGKIRGHTHRFTAFTYDMGPAITAVTIFDLYKYYFPQSLWIFYINKLPADFLLVAKEEQY